MGYAHLFMGLTAVIACLDVPAVSSAALSLTSLSRPATGVAPELRRPPPPWPAVLVPPPWPAVLVPPPEPFAEARRSRLPAALPWRRPAARRFHWPDAAAVHGKDVHWPALRRDGFMLHHAEVNRGHHHRTNFGAQPAESSLIDLMIL